MLLTRITMKTSIVLVLPLFFSISCGNNHNLTGEGVEYFVNKNETQSVELHDNSIMSTLDSNSFGSQPFVFKSALMDALSQIILNNPNTSIFKLNKTISPFIFSSEIVQSLPFYVAKKNDQELKIELADFKNFELRFNNLGLDPQNNLFRLSHINQDSNQLWLTNNKMKPASASSSSKSYLMVIALPTRTHYYFVNEMVSPIEFLKKQDPSIVFNTEGELKRLFGIKANLQNQNSLQWKFFNLDQSLNPLTNENSFYAVVAHQEKQTEDISTFFNQETKSSFNLYDNTALVNFKKDLYSKAVLLFNFEELLKKTIQAKKFVFHDKSGNKHCAVSESQVIKNGSLDLEETKKFLAENLTINSDNRKLDFHKDIEVELYFHQEEQKYYGRISWKKPGRIIEVRMNQSKLKQTVGTLMSNCNRDIYLPQQKYSIEIFNDTVIDLEAHYFYSGFMATSSPSSI